MKLSFNPFSKNLIGWYLFNFFSEALLINGLIYFLPWLRIDIGFSDNWYNLTLIISSVILIASAPLLGSIQDKTPREFMYLALCSCGVFLATLFIYITDILNLSHFTKGIISLFCFGLLMYSYQLGLVFYNFMMRKLSSSDYYMKISAYSEGAGWAGNIFGIGIIYPFSQNYIIFFTSGGRSKVFLPCAILYGIGTLASLFLIHRKSDKQIRSSNLSLKKEFFVMVQDLRQLKKNRNLWYFLLAFFLCFDAILTISDNSSYYLNTVMKFSDEYIQLLILLLLVMAAIGALISSLIKQNHLKITLSIILFCWVITLATLALTRNSFVFTCLFGLIGILLGALQNIMRVIFQLLLPSSQSGQYLGIYASLQRTSTLTGPLIWILAASLALHLGNDRYRISMIAMAVLISFSFFFIRKISSNDLKM